MASSRGGGGGSGGMRFALRFEVEGSGGKRELQSILRTIRQVSAAVGGMGGAGGRGRRSGPQSLGDQFQALAKQIYYVNPAVGRFAFGLASLNNINNTLVPGIAGLAAAFVGLSIGTQVLEAVTAAGMGLVSWGVAGVKTFFDIGRGIMNVVGPIETAMTQIKLLGGLSNSQALDVMGNIQEIVKFTPFQQGELTNMTQALIMGKVSLEGWTNAAGKAITLQDALNSGFARSEVPEFAREMKINATSIMADFAALTGNVGERAATFNRGIQRLFSTGSARLLTDQVNQEALRALVGKSGTLQLQGTAEDAMQRIYKYLQEKQAVGMAAIASGTWEGLKSNVAEIPMLFAQAIGGLPGSGGLYDRLLAGLQGLYNEVNKFLSNKAAMSAIRDALVPIFDFLLGVATRLTSVIVSLATFVTSNPFMLKLIAWGTLLGGTMLVVTGVMVLLGVALGSVALVTMTTTLAFSALGKLMTHFHGLVMKVVRAVVLLAASVSGVFLLVSALALVGAAIAFFVAGSDGFLTFWENTKLVMGAVGEAMKNWSTGFTEISVETASKLEQAGLMGFFMKVIGWISRVESWWENMTITMATAWTFLTLKLQKPIDQLVTTLTRLGKTLAVSLSGPAAEAFGSLESDGQRAVGTVIDMIGTGLTYAILFVDAIFTVARGFIIMGAYVDLVTSQFSFLFAMIIESAVLVGGILLETFVTPFFIAIAAVKDLIAVVKGDMGFSNLRESLTTGLFSFTKFQMGDMANRRDQAVGEQFDARYKIGLLTGEIQPPRDFFGGAEPNTMTDPSGYYGMDIGSQGYRPNEVGLVQPGSNAALLGMPQTLNAKVESTNNINVILDSETIATQVEKKISENKSRLLGDDEE